MITELQKDWILTRMREFRDSLIGDSAVGDEDGVDGEVYFREMIWVFRDERFPDVEIRCYGHYPFLIYRLIDGEWIEADVFTSGGDDYNRVTHEYACDAAQRHFDEMAGEEDV